MHVQRFRLLSFYELLCYAAPGPRYVSAPASRLAARTHWLLRPHMRTGERSVRYPNCNAWLMIYDSTVIVYEPMMLLTMVTMVRDVT